MSMRTLVIKKFRYQKSVQVFTSETSCSTFCNPSVDIRLQGVSPGAWHLIMFCKTSNYLVVDESHYKWC